MKVLLCILAVIATAPTWAEQVCDTSRYPLSSPTERFVDNGDGTVTDQETQLVWMRCSAGQSWSDGSCVGRATRHTWASAPQVADEINRSGAFFYDDWRLPSLPELAGIAERQCSDPRINLTIFPMTPADRYWTRSARADEEEMAYALSFGSEGVSRVPRIEPLLVRLVRTGP